MASSPHGEDTLTLGKAKRLPGSPSRRTLQRWIKDGRVSRATGEIVKLEAWQIGGRWYTSVEAFDRFLLRLKGELA
jgi:hypothetical protein